MSVNYATVDLDKGLSSVQRQATVGTDLLTYVSLVNALGLTATDSKILILKKQFSNKKIHVKISAKWWPIFLGLGFGLNALTLLVLGTEYSGLGGQYHTSWCIKAASAPASIGLAV